MMTSWGGGGVTTSPPNVYSDYSNSASSVSSVVSSVVFSPDSSTFTSFDKNAGAPYLEIIEQTASQFRFRYKSEMQGTHGAIQGVKSTKKNKTFPSVRLCNYNGPATIRCTLYTADKKSLHVHRLVGKSSGKEKDDPHDACVGPHLSNGYVACFQNLVIIHVAKKHLVNELLEKKKRVIQANYPHIPKFPFSKELLLQLEKEAEEETKKMDMNCTVLRFEALIFENDCYIPLPLCKPIYSGSIKNLKCHVHGQLRICRMDKVSGSCEGDEEIFLLVEKVGKDNIRVVMTEYDENHKEVWSDYCNFTSTDVHHQFAIVCRTPKYRFANIKEKVSVDIQLERISDLARSEPREFLYMPVENYHYQVTDSNKRKRIAAPSPALSVGSTFGFQSPQPHVTSTTLELPIAKPLPLPEVMCSVQNMYAQFSDDNIQSAMWIPDHVLLPDESMLISSDQPVFTSLDDEMSAEKNLSFTKIFSGIPTPDVSDIIGFFTGNEIKKNSFNEIMPFPNPQGQCSVNDKLLRCDGGDREFILRSDDEEEEEEDEDEVVDDNQHVQGKDDKNEQRKESKTILAAADFASLILDKLNRLSPNHNDISQIIDRIMQLRTIKGNSALHTAVIHKQNKELSSLVSFLQLHNRTDHFNCYNSAHQTPLHLAVSGGGDKDDVQVVNILLNAGADPDRVDMEGRTPLHIAVRSNLKDIIVSLIESPLIVINGVNDNDGTALHIAAEKDLVEVAELLLENGADVNSINKKTGRTPLHCAVINKNMHIVSLLLNQENIEIDKEDFNGYNPLQLSILDECQPWKRIFKELIKYGASFDNDRISCTKSYGNNQSRDCREKILDNENEDDYDADLLLKQFFELSIDH